MKMRSAEKNETVYQVATPVKFMAQGVNGGKRKVEDWREK